MIRSFIKKGQALAFIPFFGSPENPYDKVIVDEHNLFGDNSELTGFQRLRNLFKPYLDYPIHPRIVEIVQLSIASFIMGGIYGGVSKSRIAFIRFIETNEATQFRSHMDAKRKLSDKMFLSFFQGFARWGMRVSFFCTTFVSTYTVLSVYRNNDSIFYYTLSGLTAGSLYKFPLGPKGMISGGVFGAAFGSVYGAMKMIQHLVLNLSEEELRMRRFLKTAEAKEEIITAQREISFQKSKKKLEELLSEF